MSSTRHGPDGPPTMLNRSFVSALQRRPTRVLRELLAEAGRRGQSDLARLTPQALAWRAGHRS